jgi:hypothetical protein
MSSNQHVKKLEARDVVAQPDPARLLEAMLGNGRQNSDET